MSAERSKPRRFWPAFRRAFRWFRIVVWLVVLAVLIGAIWLHRVGLPEWAKARLVVALREHGVDLEFTRMRLIWFRGIVAENIQFGPSGEPRGPRASATEGELHLQWKALWRRELDVKGVALRGGRMLLPVWGTNERPRELTLEKVNGELRFLPNDQWQLSSLRAEAFGVKLLLNGTVTNASEVRNWKFGSDRPEPKTPQAFWHDLVRDFERTQFEAPTEIIGTVSGDARDLGSFRANVNVRSPAIDSPWGKGRQFRLSAQIDPQPGVLIHAVVKLDAEHADTPWGRATSVHLEADLTPSLTQWTPTNATLSLQLRRAQTPWANAAALALNAAFKPNPADADSSLAEYSVRGQQVQTPWAKFAQAELTSSGVVSSSNAWPRAATTRMSFAGGEIGLGRAASGSVDATLTLPPFESLQFTNENVTWWTRLDQIAADVNAQLTDVRSAKLDAKLLSLRSSWKPPLLTVQQLDATMFNGALNGSATLDVNTRALAAEVKSTVDPQLATNLLTTNALEFLSQFLWQTPPAAKAHVRATLPVWTNAAAWAGVKWKDEVLPTVVLEGDFNVGKLAFRGVPWDATRSDFTYSNRTWRLPNLTIARPEGRAHVATIANDQTLDFQFVIDSSINPVVSRPLFTRAAQKVIDGFQFDTPPVVHAEIRGNWSKPKEISARVNVAMTNLAFRERPIVSCRTVVTITNQVVSCLAPEVVRTEGVGRADAIVIDIPKMVLHLTNANGMLNPADITHVIHPTVEKTMAPYVFKSAPQARVWGTVDLVDELRSDLWFELAGGPFEWRGWRFQQITGVVHWGGPWLTISNLAGSMHGGQLDGSMRFDFTAKQGADYSFRALVHDINLHSLMTDMGNPTNKLEGTLSGLLVVTNANSESLDTWFGYGSMNLQDGLIWEVPVFGFFSPILNAVIPGSGNNRAKEATATFAIANGVFSSSDLRIHASGMRLKYEGTVDFDARINGRVEAQLFRDTPGIGRVVSTVLWPVTKVFEYKVTGTFNKPKPEPVFIPKLLLMPFHPVRTLRELLEQDKEELPQK